MSSQLPASVRLLLESPTLPETPKPGELTARVSCLLSSHDLCLAAQRHAESMGFTAVIDNSCDDWELRLLLSD